MWWRCSSTISKQDSIESQGDPGRPEKRLGGGVTRPSLQTSLVNSEFCTVSLIEQPLTIGIRAIYNHIFQSVNSGDMQKK